jgi:hypothetical protein
MTTSSAAALGWIRHRGEGDNMTDETHFGITGLG